MPGAEEKCLGKGRQPARLDGDRNGSLSHWDYRFFHGSSESKKS